MPASRGGAAAGFRQGCVGGSENPLGEGQVLRIRPGPEAAGPLDEREDIRQFVRFQCRQVAEFPGVELGNHHFDQVCHLKAFMLVEVVEEGVQMYDNSNLPYHTRAAI